jgi:hypothetical protein
MDKSKMHKDRISISKQEIINDIKAELIKKNAVEISLNKKLQIEERVDHFSLEVDIIDMYGITLVNPYNDDQEDISFEDAQTPVLISILEEIENDRFEITEKLSTK